MSVAGPGPFRFGDFELDPAAYELRRAGARVRLPRQPLDLLLLLVGRAGELVPRDDIARCLWPERVYVDVDAGIHTAVLKIRRALGSKAAPTPWVESVAGKGYRFAGGVTRVAPRDHKLPADLTSFIGRRKELDELPRLLVTSRLLCLTGSGGVGKTRLAVRLASELVGRFPDGVWLADLGGLTSPDLLAQTVADVVGVRTTPTRSERDALVDFLRDRTALLVLDTCEHVIAPCAALVDELLRNAARASFELGQLDQARAAALSALEAADVHGEIVERGGPLMVLANVALARGDQDEALRLFDESIDVHRRGGDAWGLSILLSVAAGLRVVRDDFARARAQATEALTICRALDDPRGTAWSLEVFAGLLAAAGRLDDAARTWGLSDALVGTSGGALTATIGWIRDRHIERVRHALGDPAFDRARRDGSRMSVDAVMALVEAEPVTWD